MFGHVFNLLAAYAEDQVDPSTRVRVERHLARCIECRRALDDIRTGIVLASALTAAPMPDDVAAAMRERVLAHDAVSARRHDSVAAWGLAAAAVVILAAGIGLYWHVNRPWIELHAADAAPTRFEQEGRALHDRLQSGVAPVVYRSSDEGALWHWLASEGAPVTSMVISRPEAERAQVVAVGAAVHTVGGVRTSVLSYRIDGRPVTLALALSDQVPDAPAAGWWSKRVGHRRDAVGASTLTWTVGGGTYVMVSELDGAGQRACLICHTTPRFRAALGRLSMSAPLDRPSDPFRRD